MKNIFNAYNKNKLKAKIQNFNRLHKKPKIYKN